MKTTTFRSSDIWVEQVKFSRFIIDPAKCSNQQDIDFSKPFFLALSTSKIVTTVLLLPRNKVELQLFRS